MGLLSSVARRVEDEQRRAGGDQRVGAQAGPSRPPLPFHADEGAAADADPQPERKFSDTQCLHDAALLSFELR